MSFMTTSLIAMTCVAQFSLQGDIRHKYNSLDPAMRAGLGGLASNEQDTEFPGSRVSNFQFGSIYSSPTNGSHVIAHGIWQKYNGLDLNFRTSLGMLTTDEEGMVGVPAGRVNKFQSGSIYWSAATGSHVLSHGIWLKYNTLDLPSRQRLGMPTSDEQGPTNNRKNLFQGGSINWSPSGGAVIHLNATAPSPLPRQPPPRVPPPQPIYFWLQVDFQDGTNKWIAYSTYSDAMTGRSFYFAQDDVGSVTGPIYATNHL